MVARYALVSSPAAVRDYFGLGPFEPFPPRPAIAPTEPVAIVREGRHGTPELGLVRWGLIPSWSKDPRRHATLFNARLETATEKPAFRGAMRHRRCLVPADGWTQWSGLPGARTQWLIRRRNRGPMAFAGLWEHWLGADGSEIETMAILTTAANADVLPLNDRMPAILAPDGFQTWLDCRSGSALGIERLIQPVADDTLEAVPETG